jgi:hypothetical protein
MIYWRGQVETYFKEAKLLSVVYLRQFDHFYRLSD